MIRGIQDPNTIRKQDAIKKETLQRIIAHRQEYETIIDFLCAIEQKIVF